VECRHEIFILIPSTKLIFMIFDGIGKKIWAIGDIPSKSIGPEFTSHQTACLLTSNQTAPVEIMVYSTDRDPVGPHRFTVDGNRTKHLRFNHFKDPEFPRDTDYASVISSNIPTVVQHTRLDLRQAENGLLSTIAYPGNL
jgi:hypothetical protein